MRKQKNQQSGIVSYGTALPKLAISYEEIARAQTVDFLATDAATSPKSPFGVSQKTVPALDEDTATLATQAGREALDRLNELSSKDINQDISALFIGSESHPYAVKPTGTVVAQALGLSTKLALADLEFACKAGTQAVQIGLQYVNSQMSEYALAIGADTAQSRPGDALEFTAGAGAGAVLLGKKKVLAEILATTSYASDTPDFWRRGKAEYPSHAGRFTAEPAYFKHVVASTKQLLSMVSLKPEEIDYCVFHTPNANFPRKVAHQLGFTAAQVEPSLVVEQIGNTYSAASLLALSAVLDVAKANQTVLLTSYGSGAGADSFLFKTTPHLETAHKKWAKKPTFFVPIKQKAQLVSLLSYTQYRKHMAEHA